MINTSDYNQNFMWDIWYTEASIRTVTTRFIDSSQSNDAKFKFCLKREPLYYMINNVYPCLILNMVTLVTYFFPFNLQTSLS